MLIFVHQSVILLMLALAFATPVRISAGSPRDDALGARKVHGLLGVVTSEVR
ncbi:hypothetical protein SAMN06298212_11131 [Ruaniaceae bacterium KH17]|nr:hypothetical protein SAMN06298212_11131 [Ruaniaceae bacterium KH17]